MKKCLKVLFLFFILFGFNSVVYASDQCYYMPGKNNKVVVPKGYNARCIYTFDSGSSVTTDNNTEGYVLDITDTGLELYAFGGDYDDELSTNFNFISIKDDNVIINEVIDFSGIKISPSPKNDHISKVTAAGAFDDNISGCPNYMYLVQDYYATGGASQNMVDEIKIGFSSVSPTVSLNSKYAIHYLDNEGYGYDDVIFLDRSSNGMDIFVNYEKSETYKNLLKECGSNIKDNEFDGYGNLDDVLPAPGEDMVETIATCSYYFKLDNYLDYSGNTCHTERIDFTYQKKTVLGKSSLSVIARPASFKSEIGLNNVRGKFAFVNLDDVNTYSNLSDYLVYSNGKWSCADTIYMLDVKNGTPDTLAVFGKSQYQQYVGFYGVDEVSESSFVSEELCPSKPDDSDKGDEDKDADVDWGDGLPDACDGIIGKEMLDFLNKIFRWIQILAPIFVIIMGGVDFAQAVLLDDKDAMKKASSKFIKRLIIAVALFFIPLILSWLLGIFNDMTTVADATICGIGE